MFEAVGEDNAAIIFSFLEAEGLLEGASTYIGGHSDAIEELLEAEGAEGRRR